MEITSPLLILPHNIMRKYGFVNHRELHEIIRIHRHAALPQLLVQMRTSGQPGHAHRPDPLFLVQVI
jgi:hypothetical protein